MPLYEYKCSRCKKKYEFLEKITGEPKTICPHCQKPTLKRQISLAGFKLKGSGWYETDFKDQKKPETMKKEADNKKPEKTEKTKIKTDDSKK